ncbi:hypothetical protein niasHT_027371 [Heterodera trifolii]|uniref:Uncharacterized protein n=1 Tax=Heterodera trifolii TaxID=157864 RepID=A0ABD2JUG3_9BILA
MAQKLRASAPPIAYEKGANCETKNGLSAFEQMQWFEKNVFGILCCQNDNGNGILDGERAEKISKIKKKFCREMENGKSIGQMMENIGKPSLKLEEILEIEPKIYEKLCDFAAISKTEGTKKENMEKHIGKVIEKIKAFFEAIKANAIAFSFDSSVGTAHSVAFKAYGRRKRRRNPRLGCVLLYLCSVISLVVGLLDLMELFRVASWAPGAAFGVAALCFLLMCCVCDLRPNE